MKGQADEMRYTLRQAVTIARERHVLPLLVALAVISAAGLVGGGIMIAHHGQDTKEAAGRTDDVVARIQSEHVRNVRFQCEQANREHAGIVAFIAASIPPERRMDARMRRLRRLAERSFPQQNCASLVKRSVQKNP